MLIDLKQITIPPGDSILLNKVTWSQYEQILAELGEYRPTKVSYSKGLLEIMTPLFSNIKRLIGFYPLLHLLIFESSRTCWLII